MITIPTKHLRVAILAAGNSEAYPYLAGVLVECMASETRVVGADGHIISVTRRRTDENAPHCRFILPRQVVRDAIAARQLFTTFEPEPATGKWLMNGGYRFDALGSEYPEYRGAFVDEVSGEAAHYDPQLLAQFGKMARALGREDRLVTLHQNGAGNGMVSIHDVEDFAGAIVPIDLNMPKSRRLGVQTWVRQ